MNYPAISRNHYPLHDCSTEKGMQQLVGLRKREKAKDFLRRGEEAGAKPGTIGYLQSVVAANTRDVLIKQPGFNAATPYVAKRAVVLCCEWLSTTRRWGEKLIRLPIYGPPSLETALRRHSTWTQRSGIPSELKSRIC